MHVLTDDTLTLIDSMSSQFADLRETYLGVGAVMETVPAATRATVKHLLEDARSVLDYTATQTVADVCGQPGPKAKVYWPIGRDRAKFNRFLDGKMPGLRAARPELAALLADRQPWCQHYEWVGHLAALTDENKHTSLTAQVADATPDRLVVSRHGPNGPIDTRTVSDGNVLLHPGDSLRLPTRVRRFEPTADGNARIVQSLVYDWRFAAIGEFVMPLLYTITTEVPILAVELATAK